MMKEALKWIATAHESFRVDMGVMTAREKSIYRAFIALEARIAELEAENKRMKRDLLLWAEYGQKRGFDVADLLVADVNRRRRAGKEKFAGPI